MPFLPIGTNWDRLLAFFLSTRWWGKCPQGLLKNNDRQLDQTFNSSFRYIDDVLSLSNSRFGDWNRWKNWWRFKQKIGENRDDFTIPLVNFPFISSNIAASPAYEVYISQLIRYPRTCAQYSDVLDWAKQLTQKLSKQGYVAPKLKSSLQEFYGRHHDLVVRYEIPISQMTMALLLFT